MVSNVRLVSVRYEFISSTQAYQICSSFGSRRLWNWKPKRSWPTCSTCGFLTAALAWSGMVAAPSGRSRPGSGRCRSRVFAFAIVRGSRSLDALLPILFSTGDFQEALAALLGKEAPNLSPSVIGRLTAAWQDEYERWQVRDLSARRYVYVWADGVYLQARMESQAACMLVLIGATPEGRKELVGFQVGVRESAQSWRELLVEVKRRGLAIAPELAVGDGALGFWKALEEIYPGTRHQRCWMHKAGNVLDKVPKSVQAAMKTDLREIHGAPTRAAAEKAVDVFVEKYGPNTPVLPNA
jgi:hypothetical protein